MKILFMSERGQGLCIADKLQRDGHDVSVWINDPDVLISGDGYLKKVPSWRSALSDSALVVCDEPVFGMWADTLRGNGRPVIGCDAVLEQTVEDYSKQCALFERLALPYPQTDFWFPDDRSVLPTFEEGLVRLVAGEANHMTMQLRSARDWAFVAGAVNARASLSVQKVAEGVECCVIGFWNGRAWFEPMFLALDEKWLHGVHVDSMGAVVRGLPTASALADSTLHKVTPLLAKLPYRGPVSLRCIVQDTTVRTISIHFGFPYDAAEAIIEALPHDNFGDVLADCAIGVPRKLQVSKDTFACGRLCIAPWPFTPPNRSQRGMPVHGVDERSMKHILLGDVYKLSDGPAFAAGTGVPLKVTAHGRDAGEAASRVQIAFESVRAMSSFHSITLGQRAEAQFAKLRAANLIDLPKAA